MKTFAISIPKPCHEDWNKMTPDAKGAFCASCQKSVHDFTNKTDEEIIEVFEKEEQGKVCGRFAPAQLSRPVVSFGNVSSTNKLAVFLYALLLAFGATLFNGTEAFGQTIKGDVKLEVMGKMSVHPLETPIQTEEIIEKDTVIPESEIKTPPACGRNRIVNNELMLLGGASAIRIQEPVELIGDTITTEIVEEYLPIDTVPMVPEIDTLLIEPPQIMMGAVMYTDIIDLVAVIDSTKEIIPVAEEELIAPVDSTGERIDLVPETILLPPTTLEISISPNPSRGEIILSYTLKNDAPVKIDLFDSKGRFIKSLMSQSKQYAGKYNVSYNLSDLQNGVYNAVLTTADRQVSAKVILTK